MDKKLLKAEMVLHGDTNQTLGDAIGISASRLSAKINETNGAEFTKGEIEGIRARYGLSNDKLLAIFF